MLLRIFQRALRMPKGVADCVDMGILPCIQVKIMEHCAAGKGNLIYIPSQSLCHSKAGYRNVMAVHKSGIASVLPVFLQLADMGVCLKPLQDLKKPLGVVALQSVSPRLLIAFCRRGNDTLILEKKQ